jgi:hypothetical protein
MFVYLYIFCIVLASSLVRLRPEALRLLPLSVEARDCLRRHRSGLSHHSASIAISLVLLLASSRFAHFNRVSSTDDNLV